jgi:hypothetical protein
VEDRVLHPLISSARVVVEHVIAGVKRCRIVQEVLRLTTEGSSDRELSSPVPHLRCAELAQLWLNPIMSNDTPGTGDDDHNMPGTGAYEMHRSHAIRVNHREHQKPGG